jgi:hypothetical protein
VLIALVGWGGTARPGPLFAFGVALLIGMITAFGLLTWWLYGSAMTSGPDQVTALPTELRQLLVVLVLISGMLFVLGGVWDEVWHRRYGGFGDDFLWPPHLLLYSSITMIGLFAGGGLLSVMRRAGDIRQRFRAEPLIGLLALVATYLVASLPSDQLWHTIYGRDITAWSLPHLVLVSGIGWLMLVTVALQLSIVPLGLWRGPRGTSGRELIALVLIGWATTALLQVGTAEWEGIIAIERGGDAFSNAFWQRPEWLYPVVVVCIALFGGLFALHALRRAGSATLVGLLVLSFRFLSLAVFQADQVGLGYVSQLLILPPMLALDLWYALRLRQAETGVTLLAGCLLAGASFLIFGLPYISQALVYPRVNASTVPSIAGIGLIMALGSGWAGARLGAWIGGIDHRAETLVPLSARMSWIAFGTFAVALAFVAIFILIAAPPTAG